MKEDKEGKQKGKQEEEDEVEEEMEDCKVIIIMTTTIKITKHNSF